jgi:hypothetical protein
MHPAVQGTNGMNMHTETGSQIAFQAPPFHIQGLSKHANPSKYRD